ncbi:MAG: c-type cytochrome [Phycisphaerales bacterium]
MRTTIWLSGVTVGTGLVLGFGCQSTPPEKAAPVSFSTAEQQVAHGAKVFGGNCAACHGASGQGTERAPALVGAGALPQSRPGAKFRTGEFRTAMDIAVFATRNMPPTEAARKKMVEADYWAVLAFALSANGVKPTEPVGPGNAGKIVLHP